ncbi:MAG: alpha/beta hydrolase [Ilumatobacteraceae bacterium]|jgi:acetyl esterase/lipase|nr:alpha/beta hydrolase [Acidimicrobiia bacterium]
MNATTFTRSILSLVGLAVIGFSTVACQVIDAPVHELQVAAAVAGPAVEVATQTIETEVEDTIVRGRKVFDPQAGARHIVETYTAPAATFAGLYGSEAHQIFKVFTPAGWTASDRRDLVVFVHGGAWSFGSADEVESVSMDLLAQGAVIVSIEYELEVPAFDQIADVVAAVRWAQANADGLGADIDRTFLVGHSAGAHLSLLTAVAPNEVRGGDFLRPVIGVIGIAGPYGINDANYDPEIVGLRVQEIVAHVNRCEAVECSAEILDSLAPSTYVDANDPAVYMIAGELDDLAPASHAWQVEAAYAAAGIGDRVWVDEVEGAGHQPGFGANAASISEFMSVAGSI